jgi:hypothetical protein
VIFNKNERYFTTPSGELCLLKVKHKSGLATIFTLTGKVEPINFSELTPILCDRTEHRDWARFRATWFLGIKLV